jgi:hypothetical protein
VGLCLRASDRRRALQGLPDRSRPLRTFLAGSSTQRLLLSVMSRIESGEYVDVVTFSRRFLADDIGATSAEAEAAYRELCEAGVFERADYLPAPENADCFRVRLALLGDNESKYPRPYQIETFGPGRKDARPAAWLDER